MCGVEQMVLVKFTKGWVKGGLFYKLENECDKMKTNLQFKTFLAPL